VAKRRVTRFIEISIECIVVMTERRSAEELLWVKQRF